MKNLLLCICLSFIIMSCSKSNKDQETESTSVPTVNSDNETVSYLLNNVYCGDTHLHTNLSMDAGAFGNRKCMKPIALPVC